MDIDPPPPSNTPDAPDKEKMDQIRRRRLEKLGGPVTPKPEQESGKGAPSSASTPSGTSTPAEPAKPKISITKAPAPVENPFTKAAAAARSGNGSSTPTVSTQPSRDAKKRPRAEQDVQTNPRPAPPRKPVTPVADEPLDVYEDRILGSTFRITLDPNQSFDASHHKLTYLPNLRQELEDEQAPIMFTKDRLDSAIMEAATLIPHSKPVLDYLLPCFKRITKTLKGLRGYATAKDAILKEAQRLCLSNCIFAVEMPELFSREKNPSTDSLAPYLLLEADEERGVDANFLEKLKERIPEDDSVLPLLVQTVIRLSSELSRMTMNDPFKPYVNAMKTLCWNNEKLVTAISEASLFQMALSAPAIEKITILGPFFRISPLQPEVTKEYFSAPRSMTKGLIQTSQEALRLTLQSHQRDLLDIVNMFVRASNTSRVKTLEWFAYIVNSNHKRRALRPDPKELSSDGFLMNVTVVLDGLCTPFVESTFSKMEKIDINYLRRSPRVDIKDETKLNADQNASDEYYSAVVPGTNNFISEIFFLTLAAHHYGSEGTNSMLKALDKDIKYLQEKIVEMQAERQKIVNSPIHLSRFDEQLKKFEDVLDKSFSLKYAVEGVLFDKTMQAKSLMFMRYVTVWLLRTATGTDYTPEKTVTLPLSATQPDAFRFLPEYILEDIVANFNFILRFVPDVMISAVGDEIIVLCITFLTNSDYIKNPYLKAKLVSLLFHGTWPVYHRAKGVLGDSLIGSKFANDHLLHALMKFYIEVESTGAHTQFYDKFNIRYEIFQVIKCIWSNNLYQQRLVQESTINTEFFLRFVNLLLNDATYVLDEALTKFPKIHDLQAELRQPNSPLTPEQRAAKEEELHTAESQAQSYMQLTNETVSMMKLFTKSLSRSFTMPEIVDRVAAMLDYTLDILASPKSSNLRVDDMKKFQFEPRTLISEFVDIFLNLGVHENFVNAVARDGRSYKPSNFEAASRILMKYNLKSPEDIARWESLKVQFARAKEADDQDENDLGEPPDEFVDPIMATLMEDPVILPVSKQIVDRSTIRSHLLSDPHDPFNRAPLKIEEVIDATELKEQVKKWKADMRAKARKARDGGSADTMDTTAG